ncbi:23S rRNA (adenine(2503)-C(2))-methyltransferase RlmN [Flavobacteriales bacterium]|jgi:23S rRNA (adenine2503-C2)-methyltransferase|nr:23S rRNA (adenine(2503)-C(2))-methyltransferase RlmN [Flavobacteriales bacterium]MDC3390299.1 23S rRNA (adenine(2503)-C(2))-methyltransferase RlmN [Flavobacteriales bacterium]
MDKKKDIRNLKLIEISNFCNNNNLQKFRAKQIWEWLYKKRVISFQEMTSLSKQIRDLLNTHFTLNAVKIHKAERSIDKTIKYSFQLHDKLLVEGVLIPSLKRLTACISSQVGCSLACEFCATGTLKLERNLTAAEIYDQVYMLNEEAISNFGKPLTNIVYMGMGEPLLNYKAVINSIDLITSDQGLGMSPRRITVSTAGISKMIKKLADDEVKFNLAISLHSASDSKRELLMPINKKINLEELRESVRYFYDKTSNRITYEYILFKDLNDSLEDAQKLAKFARASPCKINLIEYNSVDDLPYEKSSNRVTDNFIEYLEKQNIIVNLRKSKGKDISAACGQLVNKLK